MKAGAARKGGGRAGRAKTAARRRATRRAGRKEPVKPLASVFPVLARARRPVIGLGTFVIVAEALGGGVDAKTVAAEAFITGRRAERQPNTAVERAAKRFCRGNLEDLTRVLSALGSVHRLAILAQLLEGPATYRSLQHRTRLKAGPLYHHVNQLRLTNLVGPKSRDTYVLTRAGRNALLLMLSLRPLLKDARPRPVPAR
jgi:DNA-binding HxlR family transcriptional regulator